MWDGGGEDKRHVRVGTIVVDCRMLINGAERDEAGLLMTVHRLRENQLRPPHTLSVSGHFVESLLFVLLILASDSLFLFF